MGQYYSEFTMNPFALCPSNSDLSYGGIEGTNLWIVPKKDSSTYDIKTDSTPYMNNEVKVQFVTEEFSMQDYTDGKNGGLKYSVKSYS